MRKLTILALAITSWSLTGDYMFAADSVKSSSGSKPAKPNSEWNQWGGSPVRNNTPEGHNIPTEWNVGQIDYRTGTWNSKNAKNVKWVARLGSQTYGNTVVSGGHA